MAAHRGMAEWRGMAEIGLSGTASLSMVELGGIVEFGQPG